jgi:GNAT superfamily N-acetyltransferase
LCGHLEEGLLLAVGGLNLDPFAGRPDIGRLRRVYVRPAWRNKGIGRALVTALVDQARRNFRCVRLRAENADAARLYESMGFSPIQSPDATHILFFD